jgi:hypothetical protein
MKRFKIAITAIAFTLAGIAIDAGAATQKPCVDQNQCFQLAPKVAENGSDQTPLGIWIQNHGQTVAEGGSEHTAIGRLA